MKRDAILGALWGDEGKGHISHAHSPNYDWVVRFNGGANAGHTIYRDGKKYVHNLLPSVDFRCPTTKSYLGAGMVIDLEKLRDEVYDAHQDFPGVGKTIFVDKEAFLVQTKHKEEDKAANGHIGSTNRGIGPAYKDKVARTGVRIGDLFMEHGNWHHDPYYDDFMYQLAGKGVNFVSALEMEAEFKKSSILFEGAQGVMLDINHGIYPFVSCSDSTIGGIAASGFAQFMPQTVYGVCKVYLTKVGEGPMPTEIFNQEAEDLRKLGNEYGATTGRPRRVGWLDLPALKYAIAKSGINNLVFTKFDILNGMDTIKVCHKYKKEPMRSNDFFKAEPEYVEVEGWKDANDTKQILTFIKFIEKEIGLPVSLISRGTDASNIINLSTAA